MLQLVALVDVDRWRRRNDGKDDDGGNQRPADREVEFAQD
jgi:hypothetical protein